MADERAKKIEELRWEGALPLPGVSEPTWIPTPRPIWEPAQVPESGTPPQVKWQPAKAPDFQWHETENGDGRWP